MRISRPVLAIAVTVTLAAASAVAWTNVGAEAESATDTVVGTDLITGKFSATMSFAKPRGETDRVDMLMSTWVTCAVGNYMKGPSRSLKPVPGAENTSLRVDGKAQTGGAQCYQDDDVVVRKDDPKTSAREDKATILSKDWTAGSGKVKIFHGTQATAGVAGIAGMDPLVLCTELVATQLATDGKAGCVTANGADKQTIYQGTTHHLKISRWVNLTLSKDPGCSTTVRVEVRAQYTLTLSGTPNKAGTLHGALGDPLRPYSTAMAVNV